MPSLTVTCVIAWSDTDNVCRSESGEDQDMENCPLCNEREDDTTKHVICLCEEIDVSGIQSGKS